MSAWEPQSGATDEWYTPAYIFEALGERFDLDVAAPPEGPRHVPTAAWLYSDALAQEWEGFVWMNPPYGGRNALGPWLDRFFQHQNGIALVPDRTSAPWFQAHAPQASTILFVAPKIKFERPDGSRGEHPGNGSALLAVGARGSSALLRAAPILGLVTIPISTRGGLA